MPLSSDLLSFVIRPTGPGSSTQWSVFGAPTNWEAVAEEGAMDSAFVQSAGDLVPTQGDTDLYAATQIHGRIIQATVRAYATLIGGFGVPALRLILRVSGVNAYSDPMSLNKGTLLYQWTSTPEAGGPVEIGVENYAGVGGMRVQQIWAEMLIQKRGRVRRYHRRVGR